MCRVTKSHKDTKRQPEGQNDCPRPSYKGCKAFKPAIESTEEIPRGSLSPKPVNRGSGLSGASASRRYTALPAGSRDEQGSETTLAGPCGGPAGGPQGKTDNLGAFDRSSVTKGGHGLGGHKSPRAASGLSREPRLDAVRESSSSDPVDTKSRNCPWSHRQQIQSPESS